MPNESDTVSLPSDSTVGLEDWLAKEVAWNRGVRHRLGAVLRRMPYGGLLTRPPSMPEGCTDMQYVDACVTWLERLADRQQHYVDEHEAERKQLYEMQCERRTVRKFFGVES